MQSLMSCIWLLCDVQVLEEIDKLLIEKERKMPKVRY